MFSKNKDKDADSKGNSNLLSPNDDSSKFVNTAGKVGKSHHQYFKVMNDHKPANQNRPISLE